MFFKTTSILHLKIMINIRNGIDNFLITKISADVIYSCVSITNNNIGHIIFNKVKHRIILLSPRLYDVVKENVI